MSRFWNESGAAVDGTLSVWHSAHVLMSWSVFISFNQRLLRQALQDCLQKYTRPPCIMPNLCLVFENSFSHPWWRCASVLAFRAVVLGLHWDYSMRSRISRHKTQKWLKKLVASQKGKTCTDFYPAPAKCHFLTSVFSQNLCKMKLDYHWSTYKRCMAKTNLCEKGRKRISL